MPTLSIRLSAMDALYKIVVGIAESIESPSMKVAGDAAPLRPLHCRQ
jgi:hypothetical protein